MYVASDIEETIISGTLETSEMKYDRDRKLPSHESTINHGLLYIQHTIYVVQMCTRYI